MLILKSNAMILHSEVILDESSLLIGKKLIPRHIKAPYLLNKLPKIEIY